MGKSSSIHNLKLLKLFTVFAYDILIGNDFKIYGTIFSIKVSLGVSINVSTETSLILSFKVPSPKVSSYFLYGGDFVAEPCCLNEV